MAIINDRKMIVSENGILSADAIRAYLENRLSDEERIEFEQIIANDSFAADAFDGIRSAGNLTDTFFAIESVANHLQERSGTSRKSTDALSNAFQINWTIFAYAATVIGIIIAVGVIISYQSSKSKEEPIVETKETVAPLQTLDSTNVATEKTQTDSVGTTPTILTEKTTEIVSEPPKLEPKISAKTVVKTASVADTIDAMTLFNSGNYIAAEKKFDQMLSSNSDNYEAQYFSAVSAYINGNTSKAEKQFDYMLNKGLYVEGSRWYKANLLLKKGDTSTAKDMLRSLSISSGIYKERAIKKLESLN